VVRLRLGLGPVSLQMPSWRWRVGPRKKFDSGRSQVLYRFVSIGSAWISETFRSKLKPDQICRCTTRAQFLSPSNSTRISRSKSKGLQAGHLRRRAAIELAPPGLSQRQRLRGIRSGSLFAACLVGDA